MKVIAPMFLAFPLFLSGCGQTVTDQTVSPGFEDGQIVPSPEDATTLEMLPEENQISIAAQTPGNRITVDEVTLAAPGYVVIHRSDATGGAGDVIGYSELLEGENSNVSISLDEAVRSGDQLVAMLHRDDGDGEFEFPGGDGPISSRIGEGLVEMRFQVME